MTDEDKRILEGLRYCAQHGICGHKGGEACPFYKDCLKSETGYPQRVAVGLVARLLAENHRFTEAMEKAKAECDKWKAKYTSTEIDATNLTGWMVEAGAERDRWKARCEAAEQDLDYARACMTCKYADRSKCDPNAEAGTVALERWSDCQRAIRDGHNQGLYEWRGVQEDKADGY